MAVVRKTGVLQVRCRPDDLAAFEEACRIQGIKPTERIRRFMVEEAAAIQRRVASKANWEAVKASRAVAAASVQAAQKNPPVGPVNASMSLSEKRRAEKAAKEARKAKKADKF